VNTVLKHGQFINNGTANALKLEAKVFLYPKAVKLFNQLRAIAYGIHAMGASVQDAEL
jgi:hypothetical protein